MYESFTHNYEFNRPLNDISINTALKYNTNTPKVSIKIQFAKTHVRKCKRKMTLTANSANG